MNQKALKVLEYDKIIHLLADQATSDAGKKRCLELKPMTDKQDIIQAQTQTSDALSRIYRKGNLTFGGLKDPGFQMKRLEIGGTLNAAELLSVCNLLEITKRAKSYSRENRDDLPKDSLDDMFARLEPLTPLLEEIRRCILAEDEISDDASPALHSVRRTIRNINDKIHGAMNSLLNSSTTRSYLQDTVVTMRNGRYCLPVKAEYKGQVPGMVHDQSSTGSTLFIEPMAIVKLNNDIRELELEEQKEIEVILSTLSQQTAEQTDSIRADLNIMVQLDVIFARASLAMDMNATEPIFNDEGRIRLKQARHPLIDKKKAVPIDIRLGDDFDLLVITGPNTGGKTVSLKTVGLLTLMGQSGLHIPTLDRSELALFEEVYADIGDEQSIEQSLSTFSSHMTNVVSFLKKANRHSLVLFDELGAGTDPTEGAALAIAILSHLHEQGIRTMATTHYSELKVFALSASGIENACCEFNVETLSPTYRLLIGIPGKSNAFSISERLGLPDYIIEQARSQIDATAIDFENMLSELEKNKAEIEKEQSELYKTKQEIENLKNSLKEKQDDIKEKRDKMLRDAREEARNILEEAKEVADESIRKYHAWGQHPKQNNMKKMEAQRSDLRGRMSKLDKKLAYKAKKSSTISDPSDFKVGDSVFVTTLSLNGTVKEAANKDGDLVIQMGFLSSVVNYKNLELLAPEKAPKPQHQPKDRYSINKAATINPEINLLGNTVDEAIARLEKYLDDAMIAGLTSVRVVHGKGTGALRKGIHEYLRKLKFVKSYKLAEFGEGDAGVTIVTFK